MESRAICIALALSAIQVFLQRTDSAASGAPRCGAAHQTIFLANIPDEAISPPDRWFPRGDITEHGTIAMLRAIAGSMTRGTLNLTSTLRSASSAYRTNEKVSVQQLQRMVADVLRTTAPDGVSNLIAGRVWVALKRVPPLAGPNEFYRLIKDAIFFETQRLIRHYIRLHHGVLDIDAVYRVLEGKQRFETEADEELIWRVRTSRDDRSIKNAVRHIEKAVIEGMYGAFDRYRSDFVRHQNEIIGAGIHAGVAAHGAFEVSVFLKRKTPAVLIAA